MSGYPDHARRGPPPHRGHCCNLSGIYLSEDVAYSGLRRAPRRVASLVHKDSRQKGPGDVPGYGARCGHRPAIQRPPRSANGGYACGVVAEGVDGVAAVRLLIPPPLDQWMTLRGDGQSARLMKGETLVGEASSAEVDLQLPFVQRSHRLARLWSATWDSTLSHSISASAVVLFSLIWRELTHIAMPEISFELLVPRVGCRAPEARSRPDAPFS